MQKLLKLPVGIENFKEIRSEGFYYVDKTGLIEQLIAGKTIRKEIRQELTYNELDTSIENLWSVLFTTGYLTKEKQSEDGLYELKIPNMEIQDLFIRQIQEWFRDTATF